MRPSLPLNLTHFFWMRVASPGPPDRLQGPGPLPRHGRERLGIPKTRTAAPTTRLARPRTPIRDDGHRPVSRRSGRRWPRTVYALDRRRGPCNLPLGLHHRGASLPDDRCVLKRHPSSANTRALALNGSPADAKDYWQSMFRSAPNGVGFTPFWIRNAPIRDRRGEGVGARTAWRRLEAALTALAACPRTADSIEKSATSRRAGGICAPAFVVQREACGLNNVDHVLQAYDVPNEVVARMGPLATPSDPIRLRDQSAQSRI